MSAASWWPAPYVFEIHDRKKVRAIVNCCEFDNRRDVSAHFAYYHIRVPDYGVPTEAQVKRLRRLAQLYRHG